MSEPRHHTNEACRLALTKAMDAVIQGSAALRQSEEALIVTKGALIQRGDAIRKLTADVARLTAALEYVFRELRNWLSYHADADWQIAALAQRVEESLAPREES